MLSSSSVQLFATLRAAAHQVPLSMGFPKQEYWNGLPFPLPRDLLDPRIKLMSFVSFALADRFFTTCTTWEEGNEHNKALLDITWKCFEVFSVVLFLFSLGLLFSGQIIWSLRTVSHIYLRIFFFSSQTK